MAVGACLGAILLGLPSIALGVAGPSVGMPPPPGPAVSIASTLTAPEGAFYRPIAPVRLLDAHGPSPLRLGPGGTRDVAVAGVGGVPTEGVAAVVVSLVGASASLPTTLTVHPSGVPAPATSNLEVPPVLTVSNLTVVAPGADGRVTVRNRSGRVNVGLDVVGWFPSVTDLRTVPATRLVDTRNGSAPDSPVRAGQTLSVPVAGRAGLPADGVGLAVVNVTALDATAPTSVAVHAAGTVAPSVPTMEVLPVLGASNLAIAAVGAGGAISLTNTAGRVNVIVDLLAWLPPTTDLRLVRPTPLLGSSGDRWATRLGDGAGQDVAVAGRAGVPARGVAAVVLSVAALGATRRTALTVHPTDASRPLAGAVEVAPLVPAESLVVVPLGPDGKVRVHNDAGLVRVAVDVVGWFGEEPPPASGSWTFEPPALMLTAAGQSATVTLVHRDQQGVPTGARVPADTTIDVAGDAGVVTVTPGPAGRFTVAAGSAIGTATLRASVPGGASGASLPVATVRLQPDVVVLPQSQLVALDAGQAVPFTLDEIAARLSAPARLAGATDPFRVDARLPVVVRGGAPATGSLVIDDRGDTVAGRVVEPAGLPSLARDGYALVSVAAVSPLALFRDVVSTARFVADAPADGGAPGPTAATPGRAVRLAADGLCEANAAITRGDVSITPSFAASGFYDILVASNADGTVGSAHFELGWDATASLAVGVRAQAGASVGVTCKLIDLGTTEVGAGTLAAVLSVYLNPHLDFAATLNVTGGPRLEATYTCRAESHVRFGFRFRGDEITPIESPPSPEPSCEPNVTGTDGLAGTSVPATVEVSVGAPAVFDLGVRVGGVMAARLEKLFDDGDFGKIKLLSASIGRFLELTVESDGQVLANQQAGSRVAVVDKISAGLDVPALDGLLQFWKSDQDSHVSVGITLPVKTIPLFRPPAPKPPLTVTVNGDALEPGAVVEVRRDDRLAVHAPLGWQGTAPSGFVDATVTGATDWLLLTSGVNSYERLDAFGLLVSREGAGYVVDGATVVDDALCRRLGDGGRTIALLATVPMLGGLLSVSGYGGSFTMRCVGPEIEFDRASVAFAFDQIGFPATVNLTAKALSGASWTVVAPPAWLRVAPPSGDVTTDDETDAIELTADCSSADAPVSATLLARATRPGDATVYEARLPVSADCRERALTVSPGTVTGDGTATLRSVGDAPSTWTASAVPTWATLSPSSGVLAVGTSTTAISVDIATRAAQCGVTLPERRATVSISSPGRGAVSLVLVDPAVPRSRTCGSGPTATGRADGDPHLTSMDGLRYDAQVMGEYTYLRPVPGATGATVQVRHDYTAAGGFARATSVVGVAVAVGGHTVEILARPAEVRFDGVPTTVDVGVPTAAGPDLSVTATSPNHYVVSAADLVVTVARGNIINLAVTAPVGAPYVGLLGAPDGDRGNDLTTADGSRTFALAQVDGHSPSLYELTDSWRTPDVSASSFTRPWTAFDAPNPPFDEAAIDPFRQPVIDRMRPLAAVCDGESSAASYIVRALAIELAIGTDPAELDALSCTYRVRGRVATASGDGAPGLPVTVDAPGLAACTTTTTRAGDYECALTPASDELAATPPFPLPVVVTARWSDDGTVAATAQGALADKAGFESSTTTVLDATIEGAQLPNVAIEGALTGPAGGLGGPVPLTVVASDGLRTTAHHIVEVVPDPLTGAYGTSLVLPRGTTSVSLFASIGATTHSRTFAGIRPGAQTLEFSFDHRPTTLVLSGSLRVAGAPMPPVAVSVQAYDAAGRGFWSVDPIVAPDPLTGAYSLATELPSGAASALVTVLHGSRSAEWKRLTIAPLTPGTQAVTFDVDIRPTDVALSGRLRYLGAPVDGQLVITAEGGGASAAITVTSVDGFYTGTVRLPEGTVEAALDLVLTAQGVSTTVRRTVTLTSGTRNDVVWDVDVSVLRVQGLASIDTVPLADAAIPARLVMLDAAGDPLGSTDELELETGPDGRYSFDAPMASVAQVAELTVFFEGGRTRIYRLTGLRPGLNERSLDVDPSFALALTVRGRVTGPLGGGEPGTVTVDALFLDVSGTSLDATRTVTAQLEPDGAYSVTVPLPAGMTHVRVELRPDGADEDWVVVVPLSGSTQERVFDVDRRAPRLHLVGGLSSPDGCVPSRLEPRLVLAAFAGPPAGSYTPGTYDWPGGTRVYDGLVVADPATGRYGVAAALPAGTTHVGIVYVDDELATVTSAVLTVRPSEVNVIGFDLVVC